MTVAVITGAAGGIGAGLAREAARRGMQVVLADRDEADYSLTDGERICSTAVGWNFGDGHMTNEQLTDALQQRCGFEPGEVRVVILDAQPIHRQTQSYRLVDAATGEFERGYVKVADMVARQPWDDDLPVYVDGAAAV